MAPFTSSMTAHARTVRGTAGAREDGAARSPSDRARKAAGCAGGCPARARQPCRTHSKSSGGRSTAGSPKPGSGSYTVRRCCEDWLAGGLPGRDPKTEAKSRYVLEPLLTVIGHVRLRDLDVTDVERALAAVAAARSSSTMAMAHLALTRAITRAQAKNLVPRNVSALTGTPLGQRARPSRSMTLAQATTLTAAAKAAGPRTCAYVDAVAVHGRADPGSTGTALAARRLRRPRQPAAPAGQRRGMAVGKGQGRHQDPEAAPDPRTAAASSSPATPGWVACGAACLPQAA
jgi:hypothetical protein